MPAPGGWTYERGSASVFRQSPLDGAATATGVAVQQPQPELQASPAPDVVGDARSAPQRGQTLQQLYPQ